MRGYRGLDCAGWKCEPQIPFGNDKTGGVQGRAIDGEVSQGISD
jgi:hypothetical protein